MAQDIGLDYAAGPSVGGLFAANITAGNGDESTAVDLGTPAPLAIGVEAKIVTGAGTPDGNQSAVITARWSHDNTDFSDATNEEVIAVINIGTASTTFIKSFSTPVQGRYIKLNVLNDQSAGPDITTSSVITLTDIFLDQA